MNPENWRKISELFEAALERPVDERAAFLADACGDDEEMHRRLQAMLAADARDDLLMDRPAFQVLSGRYHRCSVQTSRKVSAANGWRLPTHERIGPRGMGTVYLAYDTRLGRHAAVKLLPARLINNPERVPFPARSPLRQRPKPPQHHHDLRLWEGERTRLHRLGIR